MEETLLEKAIHAVVFIAVCAGIVFVGWREPLSYRFMSAEQIRKAEGLDQVAVVEKPAFASQSRLNEPARYKSGDQGQIYSLAPRRADGLVPPPDRSVYNSR